MWTEMFGLFKLANLIYWSWLRCKLMSLLVSLQQKHAHCHTLAGDLFKDDKS